MKGQVYIIIAVLSVLLLFLLRISTIPLVEKSEVPLTENFINLKNELVKTVDVSILNQQDVQNNLDNFISFSKQILKQKNYNENVNYTISRIDNTTTVIMDVNLSYGESYLYDRISVNRTVYG